jgi:hypothetical protein
MRLNKLPLRQKHAKVKQNTGAVCSKHPYATVSAVLLLAEIIFKIYFFV